MEIVHSHRKACKFTQFIWPSICPHSQMKIEFVNIINFNKVERSLFLASVVQLFWTDRSNQFPAPSGKVPITAHKTQNCVWASDGSFPIRSLWLLLLCLFAAGTPQSSTASYTSCGECQFVVVRSPPCSPSEVKKSCVIILFRFVILNCYLFVSIFFRWCDV